SEPRSMLIRGLFVKESQAPSLRIRKRRLKQAEFRNQGVIAGRCWESAAKAGLFRLPPKNEKDRLLTGPLRHISTLRTEKIFFSGCLPASLTRLNPTPFPVPSQSPVLRTPIDQITCPRK